MSGAGAAFAVMLYNRIFLATFNKLAPLNSSKHRACRVVKLKARQLFEQLSMHHRRSPSALMNELLMCEIEH